MSALSQLSTPLPVFSYIWNKCPGSLFKDLRYCHFKSLKLTETTAICPPGPDKGNAANSWLTWNPSQSPGIDMLKFRTFSKLLLLCMGVPWRCLNLDERTPVNTFLGLTGESAAGLPAGVDWATACWETLDVFSAGNPLGSSIDCSDTKWYINLFEVFNIICIEHRKATQGSVQWSLISSHLLSCPSGVKG